MNSRGQPQTDRKPFCCGLDFVGRQRGRAKPASCLSSFWMRINHDHSCRIMQILAGAGEGEGMDKGRAKDISAFPSCSPCCPLWRSWFLPFFFLIVNLSCTLWFFFPLITKNAVNLLVMHTQIVCMASLFAWWCIRHWVLKFYWFKGTQIYTSDFYCVSVGSPEMPCRSTVFEMDKSVLIPSR